MNLFDRAVLFTITAISNVLGSRKDPQRGQSIVEYALIIAIIGAVAAVALITMGSKLQATFQNIINTLQAYPGT